MNIFGEYVKLIDHLTPNYWITVIAAVVVAFLILVPLKIHARNNERKKGVSQPEITAIKKKYNINALGGAVVKDDESDMSDEIRAMSAEEREEKAYEEIDAVYKRTGYKPFTAWIPRIAETVFIIMLYFGITSAAPSKVFSIPVFKGNLRASTITVVSIYAVLSVTVCVLRGISAGKGSLKKAQIISTAISLAVTLLLDAYIIWRSTPCIITGIITITLCELILSYTLKLLDRRKSGGDKTN